MAEDKQTTTEETTAEDTVGDEAEASGYRGRGDRGGRGGRRERSRRREDDDGFDTKVINVRRVSRMYKGGRRLRISVAVVVGDRNGHVGFATGKGADVGQAQSKAVSKAKKNLVAVPLKGNTIPHDTTYKYKSSTVVLKPAAPGSGIIAGATVKAVLELAGVKDAITKVMGSTNPINVEYAVLSALKSLRSTRL